MNRINCQLPTLATALNLGLLTGAAALSFESIQKASFVGIGTSLAGAAISVLGYVKQNKTFPLVGFAIITAKLVWDGSLNTSWKKTPNFNLQVRFIDIDDVEINPCTDKSIDFRDTHYNKFELEHLISNEIPNNVCSYLNEKRFDKKKRLFFFWPFSGIDDLQLEIAAKKAYNTLKQTTKKEVIFVRDPQN